MDGFDDFDSCPSQLFVLSEIIDKFACACQSKIMIKTLGNFVLFVWSKFKITSNLTAENLALRQQLVVMKRVNKRPKIRRADRLFWGCAFPNLDSLAQISRHCKAGHRCPLASQGFQTFLEIQIQRSWKASSQS